MDTKAMINNSEDISLDNGNIIVLNNVSLAEKVAEAEDTVKNLDSESEVTSSAENPNVEAEVGSLPTVETPLPDVNIEIPTVIPQETPQIPVAPIDLAGIENPIASEQQDDDTVYPMYNSNPTIDNLNSFGNETPSYEQSFNSPIYLNQQDATANSFGSLTGEKNSFASDDDRVFKNEQDVDLSFEQFLSDVKKSYEEHISGPTKLLVEFVNEFKKWGDEVTANGLNRKLFDRYDELVALLKGKDSYEVSQNADSNFEFNGEINNNSYGDDQFSNGMFK